MSFNTSRYYDEKNSWIERGRIFTFSPEILDIKMFYFFVAARAKY